MRINIRILRSSNEAYFYQRLSLDFKELLNTCLLGSVIFLKFLWFYCNSQEKIKFSTMCYIFDILVCEKLFCILDSWNRS